MSTVDTRQISRDSLFLMAQLRVPDTPEQFRVKVRNLSAGGMMADGDAPVQRGMAIEAELRNVGWIGGTVAWVQDKRFGIAFDREVDPKVVRAPLAAGSDAENPQLVRRVITQPQTSEGPIRKI